MQNVKSNRRVFFGRSEHSFFMLLFLLFFFKQITFGQTSNISGIINSYASVTNINTSSAILNTTNGFFVGDKVLVIQMKGVSVNPVNNINYGNIIAYNNAGNYEISHIASINGNLVNFVSPLLKNYTVSGLVQLIKIPVYANANINAPLTCQPWNGSTGGVLAFEVNGTLTFNAAIDITGKGFRGGNPHPGNYTCAGDTVNYVFAAPSLYHGEKGEGVFSNSNAQSLGKGRNANGGGGGNNDNGGGGGGGNFGAGGRGGNMFTPLNCPPNVTMLCGAMGAQSLTYSNALNKIFLGGAGGTGNQNNGASPVGGNGGGIAIIRACSIVPNNQTISSNGIDMATFYCIDGHGGGGAGGSVLIDYGTLTGGLNISAKGGVGGSDTYGGGDCHGKGGGGGGGIVWVNSSLSGITSILNGGNAGIFTAPSSPCYNTSLGARAGLAGAALTGLVIPGAMPLGGGTILVSGTSTICSNQSATLTASGGASYTWNPTGLNTPSISVSPSITTVYSVIANSGSSCPALGSATITVTNSPTISISSNPAQLCIGSSATLSANGTANYTWTPNIANTTSIIVSPILTTVYSVTGSNGNCSSTKIFTLTVNPQPVINTTALPSTICNGASSTLQSSGASSYMWNPSAISGNSITVSPTINTQYTVIGTSVAGCSNTGIVTVSVNPTPTISTIPSATLVCSSGTVTLTSAGANNYLLYPGSLPGSVVVVSPSVSTTYSVLGTNSFGCSNTNTISVKFSTYPSLSFQNSATLACSGGSLFFAATGANNYTWMPIALSGSQVVTIAPNVNSTYTLFGENEGCYSSKTLFVSIVNCDNTNFGTTKAAGKPVLIHNEFYDVSFTVTAVNLSATNLTNISLNENLTNAFPIPTNFTVIDQPIITSHNSQLTIHPLFDGVSQISLTSPLNSSMTPHKIDTIVFKIRIDPRGYFGPFKNSVIGFYDFLNSKTFADSTNDGFLWDPDLDGNATNNNIPTLIDLPFIDLFIPNGFTPNADGKNDEFFIKGLNGRRIKLTVFNRWGSKVYEKSDYDNSWSGYVNVNGLLIGHDKLPASTYFYVIDFLDGTRESKNGFVVLQY